MMNIDEAIRILRYGRDASRDLECGLLLADEVERLREIEQSALRLSRVTAREEIGVTARAILGEDT